MSAVFCASDSISKSTQSPTATGLVLVISSSFSTPLVLAFQLLPEGSRSIYQLPVDLYTSPFIQDKYFPTMGNLLPIPNAFGEIRMMGQN